MEAISKHTPGEWRIKFCMPMSKSAGLYVMRTIPTNNGTEWMLLNGKPRRFGSREEASAAIDKAEGSAQ